MFEYREIVIGNSLKALTYAYSNGLPILFQNKPEYFLFERIGEIQKSIVWDKLSFLLALSSLNPFVGNKGYRIEEEKKEIIVTVGAARIVKIKYDKIHDFSTDKKELNEYDECEYEFIDWFKVIHGTKHSLEEISRKSKFINKILFTSNELGFKNGLISISYSETLYNSEYEEYLIKFGILDILNEKIDKTKNGTYLLEHDIQHVHRVKRRVEKDNTEGIYKILTKPHHEEILKYQQITGDPFEGVEKTVKCNK